MDTPSHRAPAVVPSSADKFELRDGKEPVRVPSAAEREETEKKAASKPARLVASKADLGVGTVPAAEKGE